MKRITINNEFTQWAEYIARYFGDKLAIYDKNGEKMWGSDKHQNKMIMARINKYNIVPVYNYATMPISTLAYIDTTDLTHRETEQLRTIIPFIESQIDDDGND